MNIILGGGLVGLLARDILGDNWTVLPIGKSRFYSYSPPLADNFVIIDSSIEDYMKQWATIPIIHRIGYSYGGQIMFNDKLALDPYLEKLYNSNIPSHTKLHYQTRSEVTGYGDCINMYQSLQDRYKVEILSNNEKFGKPTSIRNHIIKTDTDVELVYDKMISTVPLYILLKWMNLDYVPLDSRDIYYYHVRTDDLDFEGASHLLVADKEIDFHKVNMLNKLNYIFESCNRITNPGEFFMHFMKKFDLIAETVVEKAICCGSIPMIEELLENDTTCIGSNAVWDDCLDIGSCIKRLLKVR